jgi:hypothetical protein
MNGALEGEGLYEHSLLLNWRQYLVSEFVALLVDIAETPEEGL